MIENLLDDRALTGPHTARINLHPRRSAVPFDRREMQGLLGLIAQECQLWGGAASPLLPIGPDGDLPEIYTSLLAGSAIDDIINSPYNSLFDLREARFTAVDDSMTWGRLLAAGMYDYGKPETYQPVVAPILQDSDPWSAIYAACLGRLPQTPDRAFLIRSGYRHDLTFENFVDLRRPEIRGSLDDLMSRLADYSTMTPRQMSTIKLAYGSLGSTSLRSESFPLPAPLYKMNDAGPNLLVVCAPSSVEDVALLWNLRCAWGDHSLGPLGIPLDQLSSASVSQVAESEHLSRNGMSSRSLYITSFSLSKDEISGRLPGISDRVVVASSGEMLTLGSPPGWKREEIIVWSEGCANLVPGNDEHYREAMTQGRMSRFGALIVDIEIPDQPLPTSATFRADGLNWEFFAGSASSSIGRNGESTNIEWPSRWLVARTVANRKSLDLRPSEPGRAAMTALADIQNVHELYHFAHAPLLNLLEEMAARQGMSWYRQRARSRVQSIGIETDLVAATSDDLPERAYNDFKKVLGNNEAVTKYWLLWAEKRGFLVKGFPIQCPQCSAKQWTPVAAFAPPIVCRGCARTIAFPFGERYSINFKYRISERLRRVYEHDAMGHLLTLRFWAGIFGSGNYGVHPGVEVIDKSGAVVGEADNLLATPTGELIPVEVKRSFTGAHATEIAKLNLLVDELSAPWSSFIVCQYGKDAPPGYAGLEQRDVDKPQFRTLLSYDQLLERHLFWAMGADPFSWEPMTDEAIEIREQSFVDWLQGMARHDGESWLETGFLSERRIKSSDAGA